MNKYNAFLNKVFVIHLVTSAPISADGWDAAAAPAPTPVPPAGLDVPSIAPTGWD